MLRWRYSCRACLLGQPAWSRTVPLLWVHVHDAALRFALHAHMCICTVSIGSEGVEELT